MGGDERCHPQRFPNEYEPALIAVAEGCVGAGATIAFAVLYNPRVENGLDPRNSQKAAMERTALVCELRARYMITVSMGPAIIPPNPDD